MDDYYTGERNTGPSYRRHRRNGQIGQSGQSGLKTKIKVPSQTLTDPEIIPTITQSKFLLDLFELL